MEGINTVVRNGSKRVNYPDYFVEKDKTISNMEDVVDGFNKFFVGIGPNLAQKITERVPMENEALDYLIDRNPTLLSSNSCTLCDCTLV